MRQAERSERLLHERIEILNSKNVENYFEEVSLYTLDSKFEDFSSKRSWNFLTNIDFLMHICRTF